MGITHFQGVSNVPQQTLMGSFVAPSPTRCHTYMNDFDSFTAVLAAATTSADWTVNVTNTTLATVLLIDADNGILQITNTAADDDRAFLQYRGGLAGAGDVLENYTWESGKALWFESRFKVNDPVQSDVLMGLQVTDTTPLDASDGLFFIKSDGDATISFKAVKSSTATTVTVGTMPTDTYFKLGFAYLPNGDDLGSPLPVLNIYLNDNKVAAITDFTNFPTTELTTSFGIQNGEAVAKILSVDLICIAKERN